MPSSRGSSPPRHRTCVSYVSFFGRWALYCQCHLGSQQHIQVSLLFNNCHTGFSSSIFQQYFLTQGCIPYTYYRRAVKTFGFRDEEQSFILCSKCFMYVACLLNLFCTYLCPQSIWHNLPSLSECLPIACSQVFFPAGGVW